MSEVNFKQFAEDVWEKLCGCLLGDYDLHIEGSHARIDCGDFNSETIQIDYVNYKFGFVYLTTSGTTGIPKSIRKHLPSLNKKGKGSHEDVWLLTYSPERWAGISVMLHCLKNSCKLVIPNSLSPQDLIKSLQEEQITHISLTPSLFRKLLMIDKEVLSNTPIKQVTFGGEYAPQKVLDEARTLWKDVKITHIYATTELGDICAVSDGLEGIPESKLEKLDSYELLDNELFINSKSTQDLWEARGTRLYYLGRLQETINVGGAKVQASTVEVVVNAIDGIKECKAYKIPNQLLGEAVALDYVGTLEVQELRQQLRDKLPKYAIPIQYNQVAEIQLTEAGKISRK